MLLWHWEYGLISYLFKIMWTLCLVSLAAMAIYIAVVIKKSGIPYSISETYYRLEHKKLFTFVMLLTGATLLPPALESSTVNSQFLIFLSTVGLAVVGLAPNFANGEKSEKVAHYSGSIILLLGTQFWVWFNCKWTLLLWIVYAGYIVFGLVKKNSDSSFYNDLLSLKPVFWAEITLIITTYVTVLVGLWKNM